jgi:hypothetical protein
MALGRSRGEAQQRRLGDADEEARGGEARRRRRRLGEERRRREEERMSWDWGEEEAADW